MSARALDRRVYLRSHPVLFALLAALRGRPVRRLGGTLIVNDREALLSALTRIALDRTADGTTGGAVDRLAGAGGLFDQHGEAHRSGRREVADRLGAAGVERLRPVWTAVLSQRLAPLARGGEVDLVPVAMEVAGVTAAALLDLRVDPMELAEVARAAGAAAARAHLPGWGRRRAGARAEVAAARLVALCMTDAEMSYPGRIVAPPSDGVGTSRAGGLWTDDAEMSYPGRRFGPPTTGVGKSSGGLGAALAVAAVNTTVAALPRAAAWMCGDRLWAYAQDPVLVDELLRVTSPTPLMPRVAAAGGELAGGCPVRAGDRMLLITRHAVDAHRRDPDPVRPAPARTAQLVFGAGPHACPGARLARRQLGDLLAALAPHRPVVVRARADRGSALPGWRSLIIRAGE
ncbi:cytochrome P450 [Actinoplanes sp. CA-030573]|uniref:cytochrome P450 n=1 Tax=Actinoplanes sp. CA-030573 TaxID=3239898 RepID=UPI003D8D2B47